LASFAEQLVAAQPSLYRYSLSLVPDLDLANEVLQEANRVMLESEDQFDGERDFFSWACGVLRYRVLSHVRDKGREKLHFDSELIGIVANRAEQRPLASEDRLIMFRRCYEKLTANQRMLLDLRYESGESVKGMAKSLDRSAIAVSASLTKIRRKLTDCVKLAEAMRSTERTEK
jgi:RNA polymerase sigma-70 factor (ECF subfamily)